MRRAAVTLVWSLTALAQQPPAPDPIQTEIQAVYTARNGKHFDEAAARREQARALLAKAAPDSPRFGSQAQQVSQLYQASGWNGQARAVLSDALARTAPLGDGHPSRVALLRSMASAWQQDGNLLKAVALLEQAAAAPPASATQAAPAPGAHFVAMRDGDFSSIQGARFAPGFRDNALFALAQLYRQLGRPDAVAAIAARMQASGDAAALASFYEQNGSLTQAADVYKKLADGTTDPAKRAEFLSSLANIDSRLDQLDEAIAAMRQIIQIQESAYSQGVRDQANWSRQTLATYLKRNGRIEEADQLYRQLLAQTQGGAQETQMLGAYAQYLATSGRPEQGEKLLTDYLAGSNLNESQRSGVYFTLSNIARVADQPKKAEEYQKAGQALQPAAQQSAGEVRIGDDIQKAQTAAQQGRLDDAYTLALHLIDIAPSAVDGQQVDWMVPNLARLLAAKKEGGKAEYLFQRLLARAQERRVESIQPLVMMRSNYARFLMDQADRLNDVPGAIERYREAVVEANGEVSGQLEEPIRMKLEFEQNHAMWGQVNSTIHDLLTFQESLSGNTSEAYLHDVQFAARVYNAAGNLASALPLERKAIALSDLHAAGRGDWNRSQTRMDTARTLASLGQFDEAETLGEEAVVLQPDAHTAVFRQQLDQIRRMKEAAARQ